ncbi:hypothetical protein ACPPVS_02580 [Cellulomonas sp. McL0617]|uniref:hypothetical protein n=1 Tax=Cellulomonas sp. McL0617 TaxID=3415675 RepID=UPI003CF83CC3
MTDQQTAGDDRTAADPAPNDRVSSIFRFTTELVAWIATPWVLSRHSVVLAVLSVVVLIGVPTIFGTIGDRGHGRPPVPVPGFVTIGIVLMEFTAAVVASWLLMPTIAAIVVTALVAVGVVTEQPRWRWLLRHS